MTYLLDTNVISEMWNPLPDAKVGAWFWRADWLIPVPVLAELQEGAEAAPSATRRMDLNRQLDRLVRQFGAALVDWDAECARTWGKLKHSPEVKRQPQALWDSLIDAMAVRYGYTVATRNEKDFRHAPTFSPWG